MIKVKIHHSCLFTPLPYAKLFTKKKIHVISFLCWFSLILLGTFLIGVSTSLFSKEFQYCKQTEIFCSRQFQLDQKKEIYIYVVIENFYQNNRMFMDFYSEMQLQGKVHNNYHCQNYDTYQKLGLNTNAGGYRVNIKRNVHPCGKVMLNIFNDAVYLITSEGGAPALDSEDLISQYNSQKKFLNMQNYQLRQWVDMESANFINYFTVSYTSTKYLLMGKVTLSPDTYQLIIKNNYQTNGVLNKKLLISEVNQLGIKDPLIGFFMFISGIIVLFFHLGLCCKGAK